MISLNSSIPLNVQGIEKELIPTRFYEFYPLSEKKILLLQLLTGAIDLVAKEEANLIQAAFSSRSLNTLSSHLGVELKKRGYFSNPKDEQVFIEELAERHRQQAAKKPLEFFICTTFNCPVGCVYCFEGVTTQRQAKTAVIDSEQINSIFSSIEIVKNTQKRSVKEIVLFGGEPLLPNTKNAVRQILEQASEQHYKVSVCTSGVFVDKFIPVFQDFINTISVVRVTIDGPKKYHNDLRSLPCAFEKAVDGINALLNIGIRVMTRTNVGKQNLMVIPDLAEYFIGRGWMDNKLFEAIVTGIKDRGCIGNKEQIFREDELAVQFLKMRNHSQAVRRLRPVNIFMSLRHLATNLGHLKGIVDLKLVTPLETIKFHSCGAADGTLYIFGADNHVYTCTESIGKSAFSVGQYYPTFEFDSKRINQWQGWYKYNIPKCRACKYLLICGWTCILTSVKHFGSGREPVCPPISQIINGYVSALSQQILIT